VILHATRHTLHYTRHTLHYTAHATHYTTLHYTRHTLHCTRYTSVHGREQVSPASGAGVGRACAPLGPIHSHFVDRLGGGPRLQDPRFVPVWHSPICPRSLSGAFACPFLSFRLVAAGGLGCSLGFESFFGLTTSNAIIQIHKRTANRLLRLCRANAGVYIKVHQ